MTASAMIFGMLPMALGFGKGSTQTAPLGRAVIGGLLFSSFATLTFLPAIYSILQQKASIHSPSLNPDDPSSRYYDSRNTRSFVAVIFPVLLCVHLPVAAQSVKFAEVVSKRVARTTELPGEFYPFLSVQLHAKVPSYVEKVLVDRGSFVKEANYWFNSVRPK